MVEVKSPGQAAREADASSVYGPDDDKYWDAIAAAAIEAAKRSGEYAALRAIADACEKQDADGWELGMLVDEAFEKYQTIQKPGYTGTAHTTQLQPQPTPPTENKDEREHCERVAGDYQRGFDSSVDDFMRQDLVNLLLRERATTRAAADKAGYQRGRAELQPLLDETISKQLHAIELADLADDAETKARQELADELADAEHGYASIKQDLTKLQSKYERLSAAAKQAEQAMREAADRLRAKHGYEPLAIIECADVLRDLVHAALAETEEKKT